MEIEKLTLQPAYRVLSDALRRRIVRGDVPEDSALPTETELATSFGVHRSTVREGLRQLEQDGLVKRVGKKLIVTIPSHQNLANAAEQALRMHQVTYRDVWEVASTLEPMCAQLAAERISEVELAALKANLDKTEQLVIGGHSPVNQTIEFQSLVAEATHNQALLLARAPVSMLMLAGYATIAPALPQSGSRLLDAHRHVFEALQQHDAESAVAWTRKHLMDHRRGLEFAGLNMDQPIPHV
ncbi:MAG: GntR family transcriptional regulator [Burkholderiaceae bacterium]|nr:GntR family transcriptional regulator [Burkholderiaceae bacterium]